jgi:hypothetical protein
MRPLVVFIAFLQPDHENQALAIWKLAARFLFGGSVLRRSRARFRCSPIDLSSTGQG